MSEQPMTTKALLDRLHRHYIKPGEPYPGGVFISECGQNGGASLARADALYVGFTSTSGRLLVGHELKVSRADWQHELDQPGKADAWADQCHAWYVVAPSTSIVDPATLPAGWGLMVPNPRTTTRMQVVVKAAVHSERAPSWQAVRSILARYDTLRATAIGAARDKAHRDAHEKIEAERDRLQREGARPSPHIQRAAEIVALVEKRLHADQVWASADPEVVAAAVVDAVKVQKITGRARMDLASLARDAGRIAAPMASVLRDLKALNAPVLDFEDAS